MKSFRITSVWTVAVVIFLIWVGGMVRSTGAGMGCPDWPKCFGTWIPPTEVSQLPANYEEVFVNKRKDKNAKLAKMLDAFGAKELAEKIRNDASVYQSEPFHATKTWIEYANRLVGVLMGFFVLAAVIRAWQVRKEDKAIFWLTLSAFILTGLEGWIGSIVVSTNLLPGILTVHMVLALVIMLVLISASFRAYQSEWKRHSEAVSPTWIYLGMASIALLTLQIILGTQVREAVDMAARSLGQDARHNWLASLGNVYLIHRTFYFLLAGTLLYWLYEMRILWEAHALVKKWSIATAIFLFTEILFGIIMHYAAIPAPLQPLHLLFATLMFVGATVLTVYIRMIAKGEK